MKRKNFFLRSAGFNVFAYLWLRVGLLRMPVAVAASAMNSGGFPFRSSAGAAFGRFSAASAMNAGEFPFRGTKSAAFGRFPAASAMNSGGFPFRGTEETAFGRFPAVSAMAGRFCRVHGRRRIAGWGAFAGWGELRRSSAVALMGKGDIAEKGAFAFRGGQVLCGELYT